MDPVTNTTDLERRKQVRMRVRPDLDIAPQKYEGHTYYVVKDPVSLRYWRFKEKEHFIIRQMDGHTNIDETQKLFEKQFRPDRLPLEELESFAQQLLKAGLIQNEAPQVGQQLFERRQKRRRSEWLQLLTNILYIKIPVFDPDKLLKWMLPYLSWMFTMWFLSLSVGIMLWALLLVGTHFEAFREKLPSYHDFFSFHNLMYMWAALGIVKVIHEFGHGLSCKAFGGEVHEMGVLLLCLSPCLYCNVSDSWTLPNKWRRIIISFAGIYVELVIASLATFLWWNSPGHPFVNQVSLSLMVVCSVSTFVFNANPLMRYDGYYILSDWMEIPNLRQRSNQHLLRLVQKECLGMEVREEQHLMEDKRYILFVSYAIVSYIYRWVVTFSVLWFLSMFLKPYKLGAVSGMLAMMALGSMVGWPLFQLGKSLHKRGRLPDMKPLRVSISSVVLAGLVLLFFVVPLPVSRVRQTGLVQVRPEAVMKVYVQVPGILEGLHVHDGEAVSADFVLAEFRSLDVEEQLGEARTELFIQEAQKRASMRKSNEVKDAGDYAKLQVEIARAAGEIARLASKVQQYENQKNSLVLRAPQAGVVTSSPRIDEIGKFWDKEKTVPFCSVGEPSKLRVLVPLSPADYRLLNQDRAYYQEKGKDLTVDIRVQGLAERTWKGKISHMPESEATDIPLSLSTKAGGPVAVKQGNQSDVNVPENQQYLVAINILDSDGSICPGTMAQVKIHCRWRTCAWWVWHTISSTFDLGLI